jgi:hypothetical protein
MNPDEDAAALGIELDTQGRMVPISQQKAEAVLRHMAREYPPSRFAVYKTYPHGDGFDGEIVAWGLAYDDHVDVRSVEPGMCGYFSSIRSISFLFGADFHIVWIDAELCQTAEEEAAV